MPSAETSPRAHARIDSLNAALEAMLQTLAEERQALDNADAEALVAIAGRKAEAVEAIGTLYGTFKRELGRLRNQDNGLLVNLGLQHCQSNLSLLQRLNQSAEYGTYGPGAQSEDRFDSLHRLQLRA